MNHRILLGTILGVCLAWPLFAQKPTSTNRLRMVRRSAPAPAKVNEPTTTPATSSRVVEAVKSQVTAEAVTPAAGGSTSPVDTTTSASNPSSGATNQPRGSQAPGAPVGNQPSGVGSPTSVTISPVEASAQGGAGGRAVAPSEQVLETAASDQGGGAPAGLAPIVSPAGPSGRTGGTGGASMSALIPDADQIVAIEELKFSNMPLEQFLDFYAEFVQRTLLAPTGLPEVQLNLKAQTALTKAEAVEAMDSILALNGITMIPTGTKFVRAVTAEQALSEGAEFSDAKAADLPEASQFVTKVVELKVMPAEEVVPAIEPFAKNPGGIVALAASNTLILRDYAINVKRMLEVIEKVDRELPQDMEMKPEVIPIRYAAASDVAQVIGSLSPSGVGVSIGQSSRSGFAGGTMGSSRGGLNNSNSRMGTNNRGLNTQQNRTGTSGRTTSGSSSFQNRLNQIVNRAAGGGGAGEFMIIGEVHIIPDERTNSILVFAKDKDMEKIKEIIGKLDTVLAQVLIESIILEVSLNDDFNLGVTMLQNEKTSGKFQGAGASANGGGINSFLGDSVAPDAFPGGFSYFGSWGNDLDFAVQAISSQGEVRLISRPRIQTSHAVTGSFFVGDTVPYITGSSFGGFNGFNQSQYQQLEVGIRLDVMPLINPDGLVVMEIQQTIDALGPAVSIDGNDVPTTTSRQAQATVAVRDGETIILGGFIKSDNQKSDGGVPVLKDVPLLGNLFKSRTDSNQKTEMVVLMRPTVLPTPEAAAVAARREHKGMRSLEQVGYNPHEEGPTVRVYDPSQDGTE